MNEMTDTTLDTLISETLDRRQLLADLDRIIISDVRRQARRAWLRRWARAVAFSFGLPLVLLLFAAGTYYYVVQQGLQSPYVPVLLLPALALVYATHHAIGNFSPEEV